MTRNRPTSRNCAGIRVARCYRPSSRWKKSAWHVEIAAGTYKPPEPPDPDYWPPNVIDVDSYILKLEGDRDGWKQRQLFLKRDLAEMIRRDWPDIDADLPATPGPVD